MRPQKGYFDVLGEIIAGRPTRNVARRASAVADIGH